MLERGTLIEQVVDYFRELAELIQLPTGSIRITLSQSRAVKIEVFRRSRIYCKRQSTSQWNTVESEQTLVLDLAPEFVTQRLEQLIVDLAGPFGYVEGVVHDHEVTNLLINVSLCPSPADVVSW